MSACYLTDVNTTSQNQTHFHLLKFLVSGQLSLIMRWAHIENYYTNTYISHLFISKHCLVISLLTLETSTDSITSTTTQQQICVFTQCKFRRKPIGMLFGNKRYKVFHKNIYIFFHFWWCGCARQVTTAQFTLSTHQVPHFWVIGGPHIISVKMFVDMMPSCLKLRP